MFGRESSTDASRPGGVLTVTRISVSAVAARQTRMSRPGARSGHEVTRPRWCGYPPGASGTVLASPYPPGVSTTTKGLTMLHRSHSAQDITETAAALVYRADGMSCDHCRVAVTEEVGKVAGV